MSHHREFDDDADLLARAKAGDGSSRATLLAMHRSRLLKMVEFRVDPRLNRRLDASDIVQDAYLQAAQKFDDYLQNPKLPLFLWLRLIVSETLIDAQRHHLGVQARDPRREEYDRHHWTPHSSIPCLAEQLVSSMTPPSAVAERDELALRMQGLLEELEPLDREIIALRHGEQLTRQEAADVLGLSVETAAKRYVRALSRLRKRMEDDGATA
jgi:RNA polymerase sigma-70 factor, ECF subfamily